MPQSRRRHADAIFQRALDLPVGDREAFARDVCGDERDLLDEVIALLRSDPGTEAEPGLALPRLAPAGRLVTDPDRIGPYRVLQRLGTGGFGVVYEVEQTAPIRRRLALKVLKAGMDSEEVLARFEAERQALALMDHPNIARVYDAGVTELGRPYFAMELVKGDAITLYCDREKLDLEQRVDLFLDVCRAVQHAHQKGVLHRDLKPSNILVTRVDGVAVPKIIDFGIAKALTAPLTARTLRTVVGQVMGTPAYMSPEQSDRSGLDADTATDVYSLGVVFYELLCGQLPIAKEAFERAGAEGYGEVVRRSRRQAPSTQFEASDEDAIARAWWRGSDPWHLRSRLQGDLDWIVMCAIATDRSRRYQSVQALIEEIGRYRTDEPVHAGPPGMGYRARKFARRHRVGLTMVSAILVVLVAAGLGLSWALLQSIEQRARTERAQQESEAVLGFLSEMLASARPSDRGTDFTVRELLDETAGQLGDRLGDRPLVEARLRAVVGASYRDLGLFDAGREHLDRAAHLQRSELGDDAPALLRTLREIGTLERMRGDYAAAESTFTRVLAHHRRLAQDDPLAHARALNDLASVYVMSEQDPRAIPLLEEALAILEARLQPGDFALSSVLSDLGVAYQSVGRYDDAEATLVRAQRMEELRNGKDHVYTKLAGQNLGAFYRETGRLEQAAPYYERAYEASIEMFGPDAPNTVRTRNNLALLLSDLGRLDEALAHATEVVRIREETLGPDNPATLASRINLGLLRLRRGEVDESLRSTEETARRAHATLGRDHLYALLVDDLRARALRRTDRAVEAEPLSRDVLERARRTLGEEHWRVGRALHTHGACLLDLGRYEEAELELQAAHRILAGHFGAEDARTQDVIAELVRLFESMEQRESVAVWRAALVE